ncbi:hypothetical protein [Nostoc flagelliforme]|uniref:hypothetical protein n=1 Tax=Nostoc flagelliforme TaxID=1306274 RepID=UPI000C2CFDBB|nr:hypothetical protein [Nostoc flagelliforme]
MTIHKTDMLKTFWATVREGKIELLESEELPEGTRVSGRPHHVNKQSLFSIELKTMSLTLTYCENFRRWRSPPQASLWGLKNNQARNPGFFVGSYSSL